ncbi:MAG: hypothetical protein Q9157_007147 [Trypethelium eluteriae]
MLNKGILFAACIRLYTCVRLRDRQHCIEYAMTTGTPGGYTALGTEDEKQKNTERCASHIHITNYITPTLVNVVHGGVILADDDPPKFPTYSTEVKCGAYYASRQPFRNDNSRLTPGLLIMDRL